MKTRFGLALMHLTVICCLLLAAFAVASLFHTFTEQLLAMVPVVGASTPFLIVATSKEEDMIENEERKASEEAGEPVKRDRT